MTENISKEEVKKLIETLGRGAAVRTVNTQFGLSMRDAKEFVDSIMSEKDSADENDSK